MMSATRRFLSFGSLVWVLLVFAPNVTAQSPTEQLQDTIDRIIAVLRTIRSQEDIENNRNSLRQILLTDLILRPWLRNRSGIGGTI
jgi:hypothetical protein